MESEKTDYLNLNDVRNLVNITNSYSSNRLSQTSVDFDEKNPGYSLNDVHINNKIIF